MCRRSALLALCQTIIDNISRIRVLLKDKWLLIHDLEYLSSVWKWKKKSLSFDRLAMSGDEALEKLPVLLITLRNKRKSIKEADS